MDTMKDFELLIQRIESLGDEVNILRDLNCNVAACPLQLHTKNILELCDLYQYHQLINKHTRITAKSATTIDLFLTNNKEMFTFSEVCHIGISDHSLIFGVFIKESKRPWSRVNLGPSMLTLSTLTLTWHFGT